jgi:hypothetical protein
MVVVGVALGAGWAVDRLASSLMIGRWLTTALVVVVGLSIAVGGGCYLEGVAPWRGTRKAGIIIALGVAVGAFLAGGYGAYAAFGPSTIQPLPLITGTHYEVKPDDNLTDIAARWGDEGGYEDLVKKNSHKLASGTDLANNPDVIHVGDVLTDVSPPSNERSCLGGLPLGSGCRPGG